MARRVLPYRCPQCGKIHDYPVYEGVDVTKEPQFRAKVMDASIFDFVCPHCGSVNGVMYPFLYHDPARRFMVQLVDSTMPEDPFTDLFATDDASERAIRSVVEDMKTRYALRTVTTPNELMEKIAIFEAELDDRVLEIMKQGILAADDSGKILDLLFAPTENGPAFLVEEEVGFTKAIPLDMTLYENLSRDAEQFADETETRINAEWAKRHITHSLSN